MQQPTLSICIPVRSRRLFRARHLRYIASFKELDHEVAIPDNGSSDEPTGVARSHHGELKSIVCVRQETPLSSCEYQIAVKTSAANRYTICTSGGDFVVEDGFLQAVQRPDADPTISAVYGAWEACTSRGPQ